MNRETMPQELSHEQKARLLGRIGELLDRRYAFPDVAQEMIAMMEGKEAAGGYAQITSALEFAHALTSDLQEISQDRHLHVVFDPKRAEGLQKPGTADGKPAPNRVEEERQGNYGFRRVERLRGNVGYLDIRRFVDPEIAGDTAAAAMRFLAETEAVIIDLRHNGGGNPGMVQFLCSYFFKSGHPIHLNSIYSRPENRTWQYWTLPYVPGKRMPDVDLYILTSGHTFSGGEEFAYNMSSLERGTIVGERTAGGANPVSIEVVYDGFFVTVPHGTPTNPVTQSNWEGSGVQPHIETDQEMALEVAHLAALQKLAGRSGSQEEGQRSAWLMEEVESQYRPVVLPEDTLTRYSASYGEARVELRGGRLYYQRRVIKFRMRPLSETLFWLDGPDPRSESRVQFALDGAGRAVELIALYPDGQRMSWARRSERH
jgi:hypothetical protein